MKNNLNQNKMKVTTNEQGVIQLEEVFNGIILKTKDGEEMSICMRDSGFEFNYQGEWYIAKQGFVKPFKNTSNTDEKGRPLTYWGGLSEENTTSKPE